MGGIRNKDASRHNPVTHEQEADLRMDLLSTLLATLHTTTLASEYCALQG